MYDIDSLRHGLLVASDAMESKLSTPANAGPRAGPDMDAVYDHVMKKGSPLALDRSLRNADWVLYVQFSKAKERFTVVGYGMSTGRGAGIQILDDDAGPEEMHFTPVEASITGPIETLLLLR